tara:strand:- start:60 stop:335 length:276 start_codon:yes stop_codon:yes gene_type:complete
MYKHLFGKDSAKNPKIVNDHNQKTTLHHLDKERVRNPYEDNDLEFGPYDDFEFRVSNMVIKAIDMVDLPEKVDIFKRSTGERIAYLTPYQK